MDNEINDEFYVLLNGEIAYVHGDNDLEYRQLDVAQVEGKNYQYYLYAFHREDYVEYFLYKGAYHVPIFYSTPDEKEANIIVSEEANKITLVVDGEQIFEHWDVPLHGNNPNYNSKCLVEGCEIPEE